MKTLFNFFKSLRKQKPVDPKDIIPMSTELKMELRDYVRSKNMSLSNYFTFQQLNSVSFNTAKKAINDLIEKSGRHTYG